MTRKINKAGIDLVKQFEGLSLKPYKCPADIPTIGYGATYYEDGKKVTLQDPNITEARAEQLLVAHLDKFCKIVESLVKVTLTDNQFAALVSFTYNLGEGNLKSSTLLKKLNASNYADTATEFEKWNKAAGKVLAGLTKRRQAEKALFLHSIQPAKQAPGSSQLSDGPSVADIEKKLLEIEKEVS